MDRGDVVKVSLDPTKGTEQQGWRPVLIMTPERFATATGLTRVVPITTGGKNRRYRPFLVDIPVGLPVRGRLLVHQERPLDLASRQAEFICRLPYEVVDHVARILVAIARG